MSLVKIKNLDAGDEFETSLTNRTGFVLTHHKQCKGTIVAFKPKKATGIWSNKEISQETLVCYIRSTPTLIPRGYFRALGCPRDEEQAKRRKRMKVVASRRTREGART